jgi:predicted transcriptional regulator
VDANLSHRQIAAALGVSKAAVTKYLGLAVASQLRRIVRNDWVTAGSSGSPR